ncbi:MULTISPECIES: hypothetical protein [Streptomyces]|uniref:Uncharacterized protein n=1 Tax=Streptomyces venezuelae (strain ATCC 10712 / CBS 650.69 / DSM 40230 / JCM 4526 / NBRC 13096 / PD 04745) TaxID=953739 RepID=F2R0S3_STRVP|nr:hypothetical protein [Streptomyces venezuelae]APE21415.1 hypothetical protein vnz_10520 [Streptomyces venezuelae]CCA55440.1 hypothetical protein SVEN_2154 [Streptomyces venezuelae ATCC 10712]
MTSRRLRVLIQHLPPESSTMTALRNALTPEELEAQADEGQPEKGRWSQDQQLLASCYDALRRIEHVLICVNTEKKAAWPARPEPLRRPGAAPKKAKTARLTQSNADRLFSLINGGAA